MIIFFRQIRKKLADDNQFLKYSRYAIGEIVLVMVGILLALQVNNWNEQRKDRIKEQLVLKQLKEDFQSNHAQLEEKMTTRYKILISASKILGAFDHPTRVVRDSLIKNIAIIGHDPTFDPIQNDLVSSDNLRLISNEKLRRLLSNWSSDVVAVKEIEVRWTNIVDRELSEIISEIGIGRDVSNSFVNDSDHLWLLDGNSNSYKTEIGKSKRIIPLNKILNSKKLESITSNAITLNKSANLQSDALRKRIDEIIELIEASLKVE